MESPAAALTTDVIAAVALMAALVLGLMLLELTAVRVRMAFR